MRLVLEGGSAGSPLRVYGVGWAGRLGSARCLLGGRRTTKSSTRAEIELGGKHATQAKPKKAFQLSSFCAVATMSALAARGVAPLRKAVQAPLRQQVRRFGGHGDVTDVRRSSAQGQALDLFWHTLSALEAQSAPAQPSRSENSFASVMVTRSVTSRPARLDSDARMPPPQLATASVALPLSGSAAARVKPGVSSTSIATNPTTDVSMLTKSCTPPLVAVSLPPPAGLWSQQSSEPGPDAQVPSRQVDTLPRHVQAFPHTGSLQSLSALHDTVGNAFGHLPPGYS